MSNQERFMSGDNVKVPACDRKSVFCVVQPTIEARQERNDNQVPLSGPGCGCVRDPEKIDKIPHRLF